MNSPQVLNGRYEVGELIGRGGMADVYLGRDTRLGRSVAIKQLRPDLARDPMFQSRFRREAQAVAGLNHPAIVAVYDTGEHEVPGGYDITAPFIVMEYVSGHTLRELIRSGDVTGDQAVDYALGILSALEYSHRSGIVHRDIKPANVMVTPRGDVKVMDFGIARALADSAATMTQTQAILGTAQYLSPEQARGEAVDARSDLYSAACLLYEMLAGRPPFVGDSPVSVAYQHVRELPDPPSRHNPQVSSALDSVLARALQKDKADRFQDAAAFSSALRAARTGMPVPDADAGATQAMPAQPPATTPLGTSGPAVLAASRPWSPVAEQTQPDDYVDGEDDEDPYAAATDPETDTGSLQQASFPRSGEDFDDARRTRRRAWIVTLIVALFLVLGAGAFFLVNVIQANARPQLVAVPAVAGMDQTQASNAIWDAGLRPMTVQEYSDDVDSGTAIRSQPGTGEQAAVGSNVNIYISRGREFITLPKDLGGKTEGEVRDRLRQLGLVPGTSEPANSADLPPGSVVSLDPAPGQQVRTGSTVDLMISNGKVTVPQLLDKSEQDAIKLLEDPAVALPYTVQTVENSVVEPGTVTAQSQTAGSDVEQGTLITITVAVAPEEKKGKKEKAKDSRPTSSTSPSQGGGGDGGQ
ncbi:Stk1 family PASTA domain-containing Ser/Thr kinase [Arthrobacter sp. I2-34]|uniref:non-specific serine/threonine protein kinase n=1 Tax=Arthrobacter hankyongi TaxID=2904801 RepID=A0ABS9LA90_9MICC|nr:Stk1 family PASTA domain-containing Ser/Thr kinase [Arthrobacter hankyongi]MCG2623603.1 Stk1 family PASTA domain-containing Ser/Thr kinase [Arthrobacter hankyongi]